MTVKTNRITQPCFRNRQNLRHRRERVEREPFMVILRQQTTSGIAGARGGTCQRYGSRFSSLFNVPPDPGGGGGPSEHALRTLGIRG